MGRYTVVTIPVEKPANTGGSGKGPPGPPPIAPIDYSRRCEKIKSDLAKNFPRKKEVPKPGDLPRTPRPMTVWRPEHKPKELAPVTTIARKGELIPGVTALRKRYTDEPRGKGLLSRTGNIGILIDSSGSMAGGGSSHTDGYISDKWCMAMKTAMAFVNMAEYFGDKVTIVFYSGAGYAQFRKETNYEKMFTALCNNTHGANSGTQILMNGIQYIYADARDTRLSTTVIISDGNMNNQYARTKVNRWLPKEASKDLFVMPSIGQSGQGGKYDLVQTYVNYPEPSGVNYEVMEALPYIQELCNYGPVILFQMLHGQKGNSSQWTKACQNMQDLVGRGSLFNAFWTRGTTWNEFEKDVKGVWDGISAGWESLGR